MNDQHIARLEAQLERIVEGAFAQLFGKKIRAQDIALQLVRALEDEHRPARPGDPRPFAPDVYYIYLNTNIHRYFLKNHPDLTQILSKHLVELATQAGYRLNYVPSIYLFADDRLDDGTLVVRAAHSDEQGSSTAAMQRVDVPVVQSAPLNAHLLINGKKTFRLSEMLMNIGRERDNHIIIDDSYASRHHAQLRLRFGVYTLFDTNSRSGTFVNNVQIKEHRLQSGDVIRIGRTEMIYLDDDPLGDSQTSAGATTDFIPPESE
ncbi:MAG: FhaA domain-containing protein [Anaerolineae bacterium]